MRNLPYSFYTMSPASTTSQRHKMPPDAVPVEFIAIVKLGSVFAVMSMYLLH